MANKKKRQIAREDKRWIDRYGHMTNNTKWDDKKRRCPYCKIDGDHPILGVNLTNMTLFCAFCWKDFKSYYDNTVEVK